MKPYPSYKDSVLEWIGEIPSHWDLSKMKYQTHILSSNIDKKQHEGFNKYSIIHYNDIVKNKKIGINEICDFGYCSETQHKTFKVLKGDIILTKDSMDIKNVCDSSIIVDDLEKCVFGYHLTKFSVKSLNLISEYLFYYFNNPSIKEFFLVNSNGTTIIGVGKSTFEDTPINIPPPSEQKQIVSFLDYKTQKIDELIEKTGKKIELLKEQRISFINHCVTKGLDPNVEMKDSGVEWIGEIPSHWGVKKLKYFSKVTLGKMLTNENKGGYFQKPYLRNQNIQLEKVDITDIKKMWFSPSELIQYRLKKNDLLVSEGGDVGRTCIWNDELEECYIQNSVHKITVNSKSHFRYYLYHFQIHHLTGYFDSIASRVSISHLTKDKLVRVSFLIPPKKEQQVIADYLDEQTQKIDTTIKNETQRIELLKEYRQALISQVVTGKIDVRDEVVV